jgi:acyl-CoA synthetase (AMP-forming)/AMP-acid ligase II
MDRPYSAFVARSRRSPGAVFLTAPASAALPYALEGLRETYGGFADQVENQRAAYAAAGYGRGQRIALLLENRPTFFRHWLALNGLGVSIVPLNPDLKPEELRFQLGLAKPHLCVALAERAGAVRQADGELRIVGPDDDTPPACAPALAGAPTPEDECALLFTSGTSGAPKGCILSNFYFMTLARWYVTQGATAEMIEGAETVATPLPMFHMNALACCTVGMILIGGALVPLDRFHARRWWRTIADSGATILHYLGVMPAILLQLPENEADRGHKVRFGFGAGIDPNHREAFERRFGLALVEAWSMTETGGGAATTTAASSGPFLAHCIGRAHESMEFRLIDDAGKDVTHGEPGEFLVRAKGADPRRGFFSGYLDDPEGTEAAWQGGWFHSGDVVREGKEGLLYFFDRKKNIVRRSGENIAVLEVEAVLAGIPGITAVAVAPAPDDIRGEEVLALLVRAVEPAGGPIGAERILALCAARLSYHKVPGYIAFVDQIPVTSTQKIQRGEVKALARKLIADGAAIDLRDLKNALRRG